MKLTRLARTAAVLAVFSMGAMACEDEQLPADPDVTASPSDDASDADDAGDEPTEEPTEDPTDESTEETSTEDMEQLFNDNVEVIEAYATENDLPLPAEWIFVPEGETREMQCTDGSGKAVPADDMSFHYCGPDEAVFVGEAVMQLFVDEFGEAAPAVGMAHEWGHHLQQSAGLEAPDQQAYISMENQADCVSGGWYGDDARDNGLEMAEAVNIGKLLFAISEQEGPERTHGTVLEREGSFITGSGFGLDKCNSYFPDQPITE